MMRHSRKHKAIYWFALIIILGLILGRSLYQPGQVDAYPAEQVAAPPLPAHFYGRILFGEGNVAAGTTVSAAINGTEYASTEVFVNDAGESVYRLDIEGDIPTSPGIVEGGQMSDTVAFIVGEYQVAQTAVWQRGIFSRQDLSITEGIDLYVLQTNNLEEVFPGQTVSYQLTVGNSGVDTAASVVVTDTLPGNVTFISASLGGSHNNGLVTWQLGDLLPGETVVLELVIQLDNPYPGTVPTFANSAVVTDDGNGLELGQSNNVAVDSDPIHFPTASFITSDYLNKARSADGAVVTAVSSETSASSGAAKALDDSAISFWSTAPYQVADQWMVVDLVGDEAQYLSQVVMQGDNTGYGARSFELFLSDTGTDEADFTSVLTGTLPKNDRLNTFDFAPTWAKYAKLYIYDNWGSTQYIYLAVFRLNERPHEGGIVSLLDGGPAAAVVDSSGHYSTQDPAKALDTSLSTGWRPASGAADGAWMKIELSGETVAIDQIRLASEVARIKDFEIRVSDTTTDDPAFTTVFTGTAANNGTLQTFSFPAVTAKYVQLVIHNTYTTNYVNVVMVQVLAEDGVNLASLTPLNATVADYSSYVNNPPNFAIDYSASSGSPYWRSGSGQITDQWLKVRLAQGGSYLVNQVYLEGDGTATSPRDFEIRVSNDSINDADFTTVYSGTLPDDEIGRYFTFPPVQARYVQLYILNNHGHASYIQVNKFRAFSMDRGGAVVPFQDTSDTQEAITSWLWDFGDGNNSTEQHPTHTYAAPGTYSVTLTVESPSETASKTIPYTVLESAEVHFEQPTNPREVYTTNFYDNSTPAPDTKLLSWSWDFGHEIEGGQNQNTSFPDNGDWLVSLTVLDSNYIRTTYSQSVPVANVPPSVNAGSNQSVLALDDWKAKNFSLSDVSGVDLASLTCTWDFGDGRTAEIQNCTSSKLGTTSYSYPNSGIYTATLTVSDKDGGATSDTIIMTVGKRQSRLTILNIESVDNDTAEVKIALTDNDGDFAIVNKPVSLSWDAGTLSVTTNEQGVATGLLPISKGQPVTITADFQEEGAYFGSSDTVQTTISDAPIEYWLAFPSNADNNNTDPSVFIASATDTTGIVAVPGINFIAPFTVTAGVATQVYLPNETLLPKETLTTTTGVYVAAADPIQVYGLSQKQFSTDGFLGLSVDNLGTDYFVMAFKNTFFNIGAGPQLAVVGTENGTTVQISPVGSETYTVTLNEGQVHQLAVTADLTGSHIESSAPVAVFSGHNCAFVPGWPYAACDHLVEQMLPTNAWGWTHATMPLSGREYGDTFRILAAHDDTHLFVNGTLVATLNRGEFHQRFIDDPAYITADQPILVAQYSNSGQLDNVVADPFMMLIPPVEQFEPYYPGISTPPSGIDTNHLNIVAPTAAVGQITLDGTVITPTDFVTIGSSGYSGVQIEVITGSHELDSPLPFGVYAYGFDDWDSYGYPGGGFRLSDIALASTLSLTPTTATQFTNEEQCLTATVLDGDDNPLADIGLNMTRTGVHPALDFALTDETGEATFCYTGTVQGTDTITVTMAVLSATATIDWQQVGPDLSLTKTDSLTETQAGVTITYQLTAANNGLITATGVVISDTLSPDTTFVAASDGGVEAGGIVTWPAATLAVNESITRTVTVQLPNPAAAGVDEIINSAGVQDDGLNGAELNPADNNAVDTTAVIAAPDLQLSLTTAITTAEPGEVVTYNLSYSNIGTQDALGTTINETVPAHMLFDAAHSSAGWNCPDGSVAGTVCTISLGEVGNNGTAAFAVTIDPALAVNTTVTNTAVLADDGSNGTDLNPADNAASLSLFIHANDDPIAVDDSQTTDEDTAVTFDVLANDSDPDGNDLTVTAVTQPANGTAVLNPSTGSGQTITYTPNADYNSNDSAGAGDTFTYTVNDGHGGMATATVSVTVNPVNDEPVAVEDSETTNEDTAVILDVLANDSDVDGDSLTITAITTPTLGSVVNNGDGTLTYAPAAEIAGTDSFSYTVDDGSGGTASALVTIEVVSANDAPTAVDDTAVVDEDASVIIAVLDNDSDIDGDTVLAAAVNAPANGTAVINGDGAIVYTPNANFNGSDSFSYTIDDGQGATDSATVTVTVNPVNDAPTANDDIAATLEDAAVVITVLDNDEDIDNDPLAVSITAAPVNGAVVANADGTVTYTPATSYNGPDSFGYTIDDGLVTDSAVVTITVTPDNDNPTAVDDEATTSEDTAVTITVLSNDGDIDGDPITITAVTTPTNGSIILNPDGTLTYTPTADFNGDDSVVYTVVDGLGGADTAVVTIYVTPVNDDPAAQDDSSTTNEDTAVTVNVLDNDADVDGDALTVTAVTTSTNGTVVVNPENTITYTPDANFNGEDGFGYTVEDGLGGSSSAVVTIHVNPVNDNPMAGDDTAALDEDMAVTITVLDNDSDADGDSLIVTVVTTSTNGTVVINPDNTIRYVPAADFNGADDFDYTISDGNGGFATASVVVVVNAVNDTPVAVDDEAVTAEDSAAAILVLNNDSDVDGDNLTISNVTVPAHGTAVLNADGSILYTPAANFNGQDSFGYTLSDESGLVDTALVTVTVTPVNDAPFAFDDTAATDANSAVVVPVLDNDSDGDGDSLVVDSVTQPANGMALTNPDNTVTYIPDSGFSGVDGFTYTISDGSGGTATAAVTVTVMAGACTIDFDSDALGGILLAGTFISEQWADWGVHLTSNSSNHPLMIFDSDNPTGGDNDLQSPGYGNNNVMAQGNILILSEDGNPNDPDDNVSGGDIILTFDQPVFIRSVGLLDIDSYNNKVKVYDANNNLVASIPVTNLGDNSFQTIQVNQAAVAKLVVDLSNSGAVTAVDFCSQGEPPVAVDDTAVTDEETAVIIDVLANDSDADGDSLMVAEVEQPANGTAAINPSTGSGQAPTVTYTPDPNFNGSDSFVYTVEDGNGNVDTATVTVSVAALNDDPLAVDDGVTTNEGSAVTINPLANDSDADGDVLSLDSITQPGQGTAVINPAPGPGQAPTITYTPTTGFNGSDSLTYTISDGQGGTATATITVNVLPISTNCELYPIALYAGTLDGVQPGDTLNNIMNGSQPGNFGWLTWTGSNSTKKLAASLTPPGNSYTYNNPYDYNDHTVSVGDWVEGRPGVSNSYQVRKALDLLIGETIVVPVWDTSGGYGSNAKYHISGFAIVRIQDYHLYGQDRITAEFIGFAACEG